MFVDPDTGYAFEWCPRHPRAKRGWIAQHQLVMELSLGRFLLPRELVHHEDRDRTNNLLENLRLFGSTSEHMKHHWQSAGRKDPEKIARVRSVAADRSVPMSALRMSPTTLRAICLENQIEWFPRAKNPNTLALTEESVREALRGRTTLEAARHLGIHPMTLYNRFGSLLTKRSSPGHLDPLASTILEEYRRGESTMDALAEKYQVSKPALYRVLRIARGADAKPAAAGSRPPLLTHRKPGPKPRAQDTASPCE